MVLTTVDNCEIQEDEKDGEDTTPPLIITVTDFNIHAHLDDTAFHAQKADSTKPTTSRAVDAVQTFSGEGILTPPIVVA
ncbi:hypothetical protein PHLCEN_2v13618 [Hermanssonia centrifuga]|uniref:Uncharacterized protein n=1 Tax=Hermanssonia centrifuga TaxID=98765 RepID=A0A2R6NDM6_9APHY|nr:hypothetical protein PHLCEN_2v13618 [Hermanssonia centrifuga]